MNKKEGASCITTHLHNHTKEATKSYDLFTFHKYLKEQFHYFKS